MNFGIIIFPEVEELAVERMGTAEFNRLIADKHSRGRGVDCQRIAAPWNEYRPELMKFRQNNLQQPDRSHGSWVNGPRSTGVQVSLICQDDAKNGTVAADGNAIDKEVIRRGEAIINRRQRHIEHSGAKLFREKRRMLNHHGSAEAINQWPGVQVTNGSDSRVSKARPPSHAQAS